MRVHGKLGRKKQANWRPQSEPEKKENNNGMPTGGILLCQAGQKAAGASAGGLAGRNPGPLPPFLFVRGAFCHMLATCGKIAFWSFHTFVAVQTSKKHCATCWQTPGRMEFSSFGPIFRGTNLQKAVCHTLANTWQNGFLILWACFERRKPVKS